MIHKPSISAHQFKKVDELKKQGFSYQEIAPMIGVTYGKLRANLDLRVSRKCKVYNFDKNGYFDIDKWAKEFVY